MNDITAAFKAVKDAKKLKRAADISTAIALLERSGVAYTESAKDKNGVKLRVQSIRKSYDFWPESSTWRLRGGEVTHRGVYKLLGQLAKDGVILKSEASSAVLSTAELGAAVIVREAYKRKLLIDLWDALPGHEATGDTAGSLRAMLMLSDVGDEIKARSNA